MHLRTVLTAVLLSLPLPLRAEGMLASYYAAPAPHIAAHRTLPKGTHLIVTNPLNGRSVHVVIADRGPFVSGRSLDISTTCARQLGITRRGVARLETRVVRR